MSCSSTDPLPTASATSPPPSSSCQESTDTRPYVDALLQSRLVIPPLVETALGNADQQSKVSSLVITTIERARDGALAEPLGLAGKSIGRSVNVFLLDVSGSQSESEQALIKMLQDVSSGDKNNTTIVVCFGEKAAELLYTTEKELLAPKDKVVRISRRPPASIREFVAALNRDMEAVSLLKTQAGRGNDEAVLRAVNQIRELEPFFCATHTDAIGVALRLLKSRGTFQNANCTLTFVGDGAFSGADGMKLFQSLLDSLAAEKVFENFGRFILSPSPHAAPAVVRTLREYCLAFCQRCEGMMPVIIDSVQAARNGTWGASIVDGAGLRSDTISVGAGTPYKLVSNLIYHVGIVELPRQSLATILGSTESTSLAVIETLKQVIADPLQITRFRTDRVFSALYAACVSLDRQTEGDSAFTAAFKQLTTLISTLRNNKELSDAHQQVIIELLAESKRDPVVFKWLEKNRALAAASGVAFYIVCPSQNVMSEDATTDMSNGAPLRASQEELLAWLSKLEVAVDKAALDDYLQDDKKARYIVVPLVEEKGGKGEEGDALLRIVQCLPTLRAADAINSWNSRIALTVLMLAVTELRARTADNKRGLEVAIAMLFQRILVKRDWSKQLEFSNAKMPENFAFYFVSLVSHCFAHLGERFCEPATALLYEQLNRCQRLRHAVSASTDITIEQEYERPAPGSAVRLAHDERKMTQDARVLAWIARFYGGGSGSSGSSNSQAGGDGAPLVTASMVEPFLYGVPEPLDDEWLLAIGAYCGAVENIARGQEERALGLVLDLQCNLFLRRGNPVQRKAQSTAFYTHVDRVLRAVGGRQNVIRFNRDTAHTVVARFFELSGQTKMLKEVAQIAFPIRRLLAEQSIALALGIHPALAEIACGQGRVKEEDARRAIAIPRIAAVDASLLEPVALRCSTHEYVTRIVLQGDSLARVAARINAAIAYQLRPNRIVGLKETIGVQYESCCCCFIDLPTTAERMIRLEPCGHYLCRRCLDEWTRIVPGKQLLEASQQCPTCRSPLQATTLAQFDAPAPPLASHPRAPNRAVYNADIMAKASLLLPTQFVIVCGECHQPFGAAERTCQVRAEALSTLCEHCKVPEGSKLCPHCNTPTVLASGCFHITCVTAACRRNDTHWCWHCGKDKDEAGNKFTGGSIYQHACFRQRNAYNAV